MKTENILLERTPRNKWVIASSFAGSPHYKGVLMDETSNMCDEVAHGANIMVINVGISDKHLDNMYDYAELVQKSPYLNADYYVNNFIGSTKTVAITADPMGLLLRLFEPTDYPKYIYVKKVL